MSGDRFVVRALIAAYPPAWRQRYAAEFADLLDDALATTSWLRRPAVIGNVLRGVLDARRRSQSGAIMSRRSPLSVAVWATGLFTVAGIGFQKLSEGPTGIATGSDPWLRATFIALGVAALVALAAIVVTALPAGWAILRGRANGTGPLLAVPPLAFAAWYGLLRAALAISGRHSVHSAQNIVAALLVIGGGIGVVAATAWAAATVLRRVPATSPPRLRPTMLTVLTIGMGVGTLAVLGWGLARQSEPAGPGAHDGILATPFLPSWLATVVLMAVATALAASAAAGTRAAAARPIPAGS